jgi:hypothetical protein
MVGANLWIAVPFFSRRMNFEIKCKIFKKPGIALYDRRPNAAL